MSDILKDLEEKIDNHRKKRRKTLMISGLALTAAALLLFACIRLFTGDTAVTTTSEQPDLSPTEDGPAAESESHTASSQVQITVSLMGDCTLGTDESFYWDTSLNAYFEYQGAPYFFENVRPILEQDDLSIINMEGTLTTQEQREEKLFAFKGPYEFVDILTEGSVEAANLANNHSRDYGEQSYLDTRDTLENAGIATFGYEETAILTIKGIKIGLLGIYELEDHLNRSRQVLDLVEKLREEGAQLIIAVFHWGNEKETSPDSNQTTLAHLAIDQGADLVVGHHPHVLQPIEEYKGKYIAYSLGNFCFGGNSNPSDKDTIIFQQTFTFRDGALAPDKDIHIVPCRISSDASCNNYQPTPVDGEDASRILERLNLP